MTSVWQKGAFLLERLREVGACGISLRTLGEDRAGQVRLGRWLTNPRVTPAEMVATSPGIENIRPPAR